VISVAKSKIPQRCQLLQGENLCQHLWYCQEQSIVYRRHSYTLNAMSDLPFTLDQLRILKAIAAEGSFKRAADSLYVSQPAVSLQVQNLERQLDVPLFDRGGRRAQLTEAGHLLLGYGDKIITLCQETCRAIEDLQNLQGGTLIVGASQTTGTYLLPRMIGMFIHSPYGVECGKWAGRFSDYRRGSSDGIAGVFGYFALC
jgi:DNA-binding transcriptional LysR family regulator